MTRKLSLPATRRGDGHDPPTPIVWNEPAKPSGHGAFEPASSLRGQLASQHLRATFAAVADLANSDRAKRTSHR